MTRSGARGMSGWRGREIFKKGWSGPRDQMRTAPMDVTVLETGRQAFHTLHRDTEQNVQKSTQWQ